MRRLNSLFEADYISEKGLDTRERTYFAYVPLSNYICYVIAESYDDSADIRSEQLAVESVLSIFQREPSMKNSKIRKYIKYANDQLKANSIQNKLQVSILVIVSDYTRMRYAGCGNAKLFIVSENQLVYESKTQTRYQSIIEDDIYEEPLDITEAYNLTQYLGKDRELNISVSEKIDLFENSSIALMTCNAWNKMLVYNRNGINMDKRGAEILDAYEEAKTNGEFLLNLEEMLLNMQHEKEIRSYTLLSIVITKTFKEDTAKKKKRNKWLLIIGTALLALAIVFIVAVTVIRYNDRVLLNEIIELDTEGVRYSGYGNYIKTLERYRAADELTKKINLRNWQFTNEKRELIKKIRDRLALFTAIDEGNNLIETKNYSNARTIYNYIKNEADGNVELGLTSMSRETLRKINYYLEASNLTSVGEMYELTELYSQALLNYNKALKLIEMTDDYESRKALQLKIFDAEKKMTERQKVQIDMIASEEERDRQKLYDAQMQNIQEFTVKAAEAERAGNVAEAVSCYEQIASVYIDMGVIDERLERALQKIDDLEKAETQRGEQAQYDAQMQRVNELTVRANAAERANNSAEAIRYYDQIIEIYENMDIFDERYERTHQKIMELEREQNVED